MVKILLTLIFAISLAAVSACQSNKIDAPNKQANTAPANAAATAANPTGEQKVTINSPDGLKLVGSLYTAEKPDSPAVLLLHQWQSDRHSYDDFAKRMQGKGFAVLSIDGRGFGESTKAADGMTVSAERTDAAVKAMLGDVGAAFDFLSTQRNVDPARVGIVGASYGSSLAIIYASDNPKVKTVALLSPGLNYFGNMATEPAFRKYGPARPVLLVAAKDDTESDQAATKLVEGSANDTRAQVILFPKGGHGTGIFKAGVGLEDELEGFLTKSLGK